MTNLDVSPTDAYRHHTHTEDNTDNSRGVVEGDRYHRRHAVCELAIRDLKGSGGLAHLPSGVFNANAAWLLCAALAHNLYRQIAILGQPRTSPQLVYGRTIRTRLFGLPGRVVNHSGKPVLRLPARWPWATAYLTCLTNLRNLPRLC